MRIRFYFILTISLVVSTLSSQEILNGGFESYNPANNLEFRRVVAGSTNLQGWTVVKDVDIIGSYWRAPEGRLSLDLNASSSGEIRQSLALSPGTKYALTFLHSANPNCDGIITRFNLKIENIDTIFTFPSSGFSNSNMPWIRREIIFTSSTDNAELSCISLNEGFCGAALDDFRFVPIDCNGVVGGLSQIDLCGVCRDPNDPNYNDCVDCSGVPFGNMVQDLCGLCLLPDDPLFNQTCIDCAGVPAGSSVVDLCGECLEPNHPIFNACLDCSGVPFGNFELDDCNQCLSPLDTLFNSCIDCKGVAFGNAIVDDCGECHERSSALFNSSCDPKSFIWIPNIFSPNGSFSNRQFRIFKDPKIQAFIRNIYIFNRWGELVYKVQNLPFDGHEKWWNGTFKGQFVQNGVFVYLIDVEFSSGTIVPFTGTITIIY